MSIVIHYDRIEGRSICGEISSIRTGFIYATSAEMAKELGSFPGYERNKKNMLRVIRNHRRAAFRAPDSEYESLSIKPVGIDSQHCPPELLKAAQQDSNLALKMGEKYE